jgi:hypothetical protein
MASLMRQNEHFCGNIDAVLPCKRAVSTFQKCRFCSMKPIVLPCESGTFANWRHRKRFANAYF